MDAESKARRPRWHHLYFALGALDLITVGVGLWLSHSLSASYRDAVAESQRQSALLSEVMELGALAQAVNAPGNDVFETRNVAVERARRDVALSRFETYLTQLAQNASARVVDDHTAAVADALDRALVAMAAMSAEADTIFRHFEHGRPSAAGQNMASMDRKFAELSAAIAAAAAAIQSHQQESLALQSREAQALQSVESVIALLMMLMVVGLTFYGHRIGKMSDKAARTEEELSAALREVAAFFDVSADALTILDSDTRITRGNAAAATMFDMAECDLLGKRLSALHDSEDTAAIDAALAVLGDSDAIELFGRVRNAGQLRYLHWRFSRRGAVLFGAATDITERKRVAVAADRRQQIEAIIADMQNELIVSGSMHFSLHRALGQLLPMYDAHAAAICELGRNEDGSAHAPLLAHVKVEGREDAALGADQPSLQHAEFQPDIVRECIAEGQLFGGLSAANLGAAKFVGLPIVLGGGPIGMLALAGPGVSGNETAMELQPLLTAFGDLLLAQRDAERRRASEEQARTLARHDALTGLGNRRYLDEQFEYRTDHPDAKFGLILIDLDRFKPINDAHGHLVGDYVLKIVAQRLRNAARGDCAVARLGGDEFAILTEPDCYGKGVREVADRVLNVLLEPMGVNDLTLTVGASVGVAMYPADADAAQELLHLADAAMYRAKERRGEVQFFDASMDEGLRLKAELESELRAAIEADEIVPFFQPIVSLETESVVGHEVLARWRHKTRGFVAPATFIPIAEDAGLIDRIFWRLLRAACAEHARAGAETMLSINLSPVQIKDALFAQRLLQTLTEIGFPARRLEVEVTESAMLGDMERARAMLVSLRNQGVSIALDDFGTGYSSLLMLRDLPISKVKIDQSFVRGLGVGGDGDAVIIDAILGMAVAMKLAVTAEGIESAEVAARVRAKGRLLGQGYYFGKPGPRISLTLEGQARTPFAEPEISKAS